MKRFKNILYFADDSRAPDHSLARAVALAGSNQARLTVVDVLDKVDGQIFSPNDLAKATREALIARRQEELDYMVQPYVDDHSLIYTKVVTGNPFIEVIRLVLNNHFDLVMKGAKHRNQFYKKVFGSIEMHLLRKCPCPVWIDKSETPEPYHSILASVDPETEESAACDELIMQLASSLAIREGAKLNVVHAWEIYGESLLRSPRHHFSEIEFRELQEATFERHEQTLNNLLKPYDLSTLDPAILIEKGKPSEIILKTEKAKEADLIVMGTVGRTGIPGLIIGNTAEDVLSNTNASVLVVKPEGFICPVSAS